MLIIFINPLAYDVFPNLHNELPSYVLTAQFNGVITVLDVNNSKDHKVFLNTNKIDLTKFTGKLIEIDLLTVDGNCALLQLSLDDIPKAIKDSMILWYDIQRQGATNESLKADPTLKDLSGNGHNMTLHNFAFSGMSGVGGFTTDFSKYAYDKSRGTAERTSLKIIILNANITRYPIVFTKDMPNKITIKVTGLSEDYILYIDGFGLCLSEDGVYTFVRKENSGYIGFGVSQLYESCNIIIELLPEYPNALVTDGVDDYGFVDGLPLLNDYTIIAKRIYLDPVSAYSLFSKKNSNAENNLGAFGFEMRSLSNSLINMSFGQNNYVSSFQTDNISYLSTNEYNGAIIKKGNTVDSDEMVFNRYYTNINNYYGNVCLYSVILFNRTLTDEEITWVKQHLMSNDDEVA